jgi:hypothetical protein
VLGEFRTNEGDGNSGSLIHGNSSFEFPGMTENPLKSSVRTTGFLFNLSSNSIDRG